MRTKSKKRGLTPRQVKAIQALLAEPTITSAAKASSVGEATLFRWLNDPDFSEAYREARGRLLESALTILQSASADAAECLHDIVKDEKVSVYARLSAAKYILELALKAHDAFEIEERLEALEALLQSRAPENIRATNGKLR